MLDLNVATGGALGTGCCCADPLNSIAVAISTVIPMMSFTGFIAIPSLQTEYQTRKSFTRNGLMVSGTELDLARRGLIAQFLHSFGQFHILDWCKNYSLRSPRPR
jgi:hypothetical protein